MRWNEHCEYIYSKTKYLIFVFYKLSKLITTDTLKMIYYTLFHSIISYRIIAWGGAYSNSKNLLIKLQIRLLNPFTGNVSYMIKKSRATTGDVSCMIKLNNCCIFQPIHFKFGV